MEQIISEQVTNPSSSDVSDATQARTSVTSASFAASSSAIGQTLEALAATIAARKDAGQESYTHALLSESADFLLGKLGEEADEVVESAQTLEAMRASGASETEMAREQAHLRYEAGDLFYHALVALERWGISLDDLAAELNSRMTEEERPEAARVFSTDEINRGEHHG